MLIVWSTTYLKNSLMLMGSHLSKSTSDLKQNANQLVAPFFGEIFHTLSQGVICLVPTVSSRTQFLRGWNSPANQQLPFQGF